MDAARIIVNCAECRGMAAVAGMDHMLNFGNRHPSHASQVRNLILVILVLIAVWWVRRQILRIGEARAKRVQDAPAAPAQQFVACAHCGLHVPEGEGVSDAAGFYCSDAHRRLGPRN